MKGWIAPCSNEIQLGAGFAFNDHARHRCRITAGDLFFFRDETRLLAVARVQSVVRLPSTRQVEHCPTCGLGDIRLRSRRSSPYRCLNGHEFREPARSERAGLQYRAGFGADHLRVRAPITLMELRPFELTNSRQLVVRPCDAAGLLRYLLRRDHGVAAAARRWAGASTAPGDGDADTSAPAEIIGQREHQHKAILQRRGFKTVRDELLRSMGHCAISGCALPALLEVACIQGVSRGRSLSNSLLLRADLHTLFDLNLIGIDPDQLAVAVHPSLVGTSYMDLDGAPLAITVGQGRRRALAARWLEFSAVATPSARTETHYRGGAHPEPAALAASPASAL